MDSFRRAAFNLRRLVALAALAALVLGIVGGLVIVAIRSADDAGAYAARVRQLIDGGRSFVRIGQGPDGPRVEFKAEIGAFALGVAQVQGVWTHPDLRGHGLGAAGTAAVVEHAYALGARTVSLYVNDCNATARAVYRRVGFDQVGSYATVVL